MHDFNETYCVVISKETLDSPLLLGYSASVLQDKEEPFIVCVSPRDASAAESIDGFKTHMSQGRDTWTDVYFNRSQQKADTCLSHSTWRPSNNTSPSSESDGGHF